MNMGKLRRPARGLQIGELIGDFIVVFVVWKKASRASQIEKGQLNVRCSDVLIRQVFAGINNWSKMKRYHCFNNISSAKQLMTVRNSHFFLFDARLKLLDMRNCYGSPSYIYRIEIL